MSLATEGVSCALCLRADDPSAVLVVPIASAISEDGMTAVVCRDCAARIARAVAAADELPAPEANSE